MKFSIIEVGALSLGSPEPFYGLLDLFPGSQIYGFEIDEEVCDSMNADARPGIKYFPFALGMREERRDLYVTNHPMCSSLYEPNQKLIGLFNNFEVSFQKFRTSVDTISLDKFVRENLKEPVDFIKMDIQGAELDVLRGGGSTLEDVVALISEVEFVPHYIDQPLFGDVCKFLDERDFMFHKFLGLMGRSLKPIVLNGNVNFATQHIWSDAVFVRHIQKLDMLTLDQLCKLSIISALYGSPDLCYFCFLEHDKRCGSELAKEFGKIV